MLKNIATALGRFASNTRQWVQRWIFRSTAPTITKIYDWSQERTGKVSRPTATLFGHLWFSLFAPEITHYRARQAIPNHTVSLEFQFRLQQFNGRTANGETLEACARILLRQSGE
jgi:hypothetical protein